MKSLKSVSRFLAFPIFLLAGSCVNDPAKKPQTGIPSLGSFQVSLWDSSEISPTAYSTVFGQIYTGPTPPSLVWVEKTKSGECRLLTPKVPFCDPGCGSEGACVEDGVCRKHPVMMGAGRISVNGLKTKANANSFTMDLGPGGYQPPGGTIVDYPPCDEGAAVTFAASGGDSISAFTVSAKGISPLTVLNDSVTLADGRPVDLEWSPPKQAGNTTVFVTVDISHHGGIKGKIECEGADDGKMQIAGTLVDGLKALGVSGFPKIEISRKAEGINADLKVSLIIESLITKFVNIPGLISCNGDGDCPAGQTCQQDAQCK